MKANLPPKASKGPSGRADKGLEEIAVENYQRGSKKEYRKAMAHRNQLGKSYQEGIEVVADQEKGSRNLGYRL